MDTIDQAAPFAIEALVFIGDNDVFFAPLGPALAAKFSNGVTVRSTTAGHHLPYQNDATFPRTLTFIEGSPMDAPTTATPTDAPPTATPTNTPTTGSPMNAPPTATPTDAPTRADTPKPTEARTPSPTRTENETPSPKPGAEMPVPPQAEISPSPTPLDSDAAPRRASVAAVVAATAVCLGLY